MTGAIDVFAIETVRARRACWSSSPRRARRSPAEFGAAGMAAEGPPPGGARAGGRSASRRRRRAGAGRRRRRGQAALADRLHAALHATYAETVRLGDQLGAEQADHAQALARADGLCAEVLHVREQATQAQTDAARTIEVKQRVADRLHAALRATYAEAARLDEQLGTEQADRARMMCALRAIQDHASTITTRSRAYRLLRLLTGLRRRMEMIAAEAARAPPPRGRMRRRAIPGLARARIPGFPEIAQFAQMWSIMSQIPCAAATPSWP